jgi:ATP-dependent Clp protease ATP-binding subunit ClpC
MSRQGDLGFKAKGEDETYEAMKRKLIDEAKKVFRPEFLNRIDDTIVFHPLRREDLEKIIEIELKELKTRLKEKKIEISMSSEVLKFLIDKGYDPTYGARPLKRTIQRYVENVLAEEILSGKFQEGDKIRAELRGEIITFEKISTPVS